VVARRRQPKLTRVRSSAASDVYKRQIADGVKTEKSDEKVSENFVSNHISIGIQALLEIKSNGTSVKHLKFPYSEE